MTNPNEDNKSQLQQAIQNIINRYSREKKSNTPDFILAEYLMKCLDAFEWASNRREAWYGKSLHIGETK